MDPLSDVIALLKPQSYITSGFDAGGDWAIDFMGLRSHIKCYAVTNGVCWLSVEDISEPVRLSAGDCFVLASGRSFRLASDLKLRGVAARSVFSGARRGGIVTHNGGGDFFMFGSRFEINVRHADVLLRTLPPIIHLDASNDQAALRWSIERMAMELREDRPGASLMAQHLAHMMLVQGLRMHLSRAAAGEVGWFFALADTKLSAAIKAMHENPAHDWTLAELATKAGMSRSIFADRFRQKVGETPIKYLTRWRMMLASDRLTHTTDSLSQIAAALGYDSENAFNTAFKRVMGHSPRRYARASALQPGNNSGERSLI